MTCEGDPLAFGLSFGFACGALIEQSVKSVRTEWFIDYYVIVFLPLKVVKIESLIEYLVELRR